MIGKKRCRKAQVTAFILIGIILIVAASFFAYITYIAKRAPSEDAVTENLPESLDKLSLDNLMRTCIKKAADPKLKSIAKYGGTLDPDPNQYRLYNHTRYRYLCRQAPGYSDCVNALLTRESMQKELEENVRGDAVSCVDKALNFYTERGYDIETGNARTNVIVGTDDVNVILIYPVTASKGDNKISVSEYSVRFDYPLGKLYDLAMKIINKEEDAGHFNQEGWMYNHSAEILVQKHRPYPDTVYRISKYDWAKREWYIFNFAIQGYDDLKELAGLAALGGPGSSASSPSSARSTAYDQDIGCCYNEDDGNCFENSDKTQCSDEGMEWRRGSCVQSGFQCESRSEKRYDNRTGLCNGRECRDCMGPTYSSGDDPEDPDTWTGPARMHGESWCEYEGPTGNGKDFVGSRHYKHVCIDGTVMVEECRDYRDQMCVEDEKEINGETLTRAVCRPNRWQDCHLYSDDEDSCLDTSKRDCYWSDMQDNFVVGKPSDQDPDPDTPYEDRYCVPKVAPGLKFWNTIEGMQVCGWANNYYECDMPGCFQEWVDFDAAFCAMQGDCGIHRNYLGNLPRLSLSGSMPGENLPGVPAELKGLGFTSSTSTPSDQLFETTLPGENQAFTQFYGNYMGDLPLSPEQWGQPEVTPDLFVHDSPNDYSMYGMTEFTQEFAQWGLDRIENIDADLYDYLLYGDSIEWTSLSTSTCNVWAPSTSAEDCEKCNGNPYRPCTEYKCRSLGQFCNYEEVDGVGRCTSYQASTIGKPVVRFDGAVTEGHDIDDAALPAGGEVYLGKEIKEPLQRDFTFRVETNREAQCKLAMAPNAGFAFNPPFPGTSQDYSFSRKHNLTIPYISTESLSIIRLPMQMASAAHFNPDDYWNMLKSMMDEMIDYVDDIADDCFDCNPDDGDYSDCDDGRLIFLSESDCDDMEDVEDKMKDMRSEMTNLWNNQLKDQIEQWMSFAEDNALDEVMSYAAMQNKHHAFIKCRDRGGNENKADLDFIRFEIDPNPLPPPEEEPDKPPELIRVEPQNWTEQGPDEGSDDEKTVYVFTDQLAECGYTKDESKTSSVVYMDDFDCPSSTYEGGHIGGYLCQKTFQLSELTTEGSPLYIRCADHPEHYEAYNFRFEQGENFNAPSDIKWIPPDSSQPGTVIIDDPRTINESKPVISVPSTSVRLFVQFNTKDHDHENALECRYATSPDQTSSGTALVDPSSGEPECDNCTGMLTVSSGTDYYMSCHFKHPERLKSDISQYVLKVQEGGSGES
ncbi:MAG: hypothetical protein R6U32_04540 [Candidatus Woesearchaeota archaeon]